MPFNFTALKTAVPAPDEAYGWPLLGVGRRGKYLILRFNPVSFVIHLMQGGRSKGPPTEPSAAGFENPNDARPPSASQGLHKSSLPLPGAVPSSGNGDAVPLALVVDRSSQHDVVLARLQPPVVGSGVPPLEGRRVKLEHSIHGLPRLDRQLVPTLQF